MQYKEQFLSKLVFSCREAKRKNGLFLKKLGKAWKSKREYVEHFFTKRIKKKNSVSDNFGSTPKTNTRKSLSDEKLRIGEDRLAVYTCVFGGYDDVEEPFIRGQYCDYYIVSDRKISERSKWKQIEPKEYPEGFDTWHPAIKNRYFKMHPDVLFSNYKFSLYIDGNFRPIADMYPFLIQMKECHSIFGLFNQPVWNCLYDMTDTLIKLKLVNQDGAKLQINQYLSEGFPKQWGLFECGFILREHCNIKCKKIMDTWWDEYFNGEKRDQMCFTYVLWKNGIQFSDVCNFGKNMRKSSRLKEKAHNCPHSKV